MRVSSGVVDSRVVPAAVGARERGMSAGLALILAVAFMVVLDFSIVNVALAAIERELRADATTVQWVITAYAITFGGLLVLGGRIGDLFGRRRMFVAGLVLFSLASLVGGLSTNIGMLVVARAIQGAGAAVVAPAALSLITTSVPEGHARTRALGLYGATASIGFVAGLVLGGLLVQFFDWRAVLWVNVPIGLAAAVLAPVLIPKPAASTSERARLDVGGAVLVTGSIAALVYAVSQGPASGWFSARTDLSLLVSFVLLAGFVAVELAHPSPLVRLTLLRLRSLRVANAFMVAMGAWSAGELLVMPLYLQLALHYSPLLTGFAMAPQGVVGFVAASGGPRLVRRAGIRRYLAVSGAAAATGLLLLGLFVVTRTYPLLLVGFLFAGCGSASGAFGATVLATEGVADDEQGLAGGLVNMSRQVGAAVGVAVAAAIIGTSVAPGVSVVPDRSAMLVVAGAAVLAVVLAMRVLRPVPVTPDLAPAIPPAVAAAPALAPASAPARSVAPAIAAPPMAPAVPVTASAVGRHVSRRTLVRRARTSACGLGRLGAAQASNPPGVPRVGSDLPVRLPIR